MEAQDLSIREAIREDIVAITRSDVSDADRQLFRYWTDSRIERLGPFVALYPARPDRRYEARVTLIHDDPRFERVTSRAIYSDDISVFEAEAKRLASAWQPGGSYATNRGSVYVSWGYDHPGVLSIALGNDGRTSYCGRADLSHDQARAALNHLTSGDPRWYGQGRLGLRLTTGNLVTVDVGEGSPQVTVSAGHFTTALQSALRDSEQEFRGERVA